MKQWTSSLLALLLILTMASALVACGTPPKDLWKDATYTADATVGEGDKQLTVVIEAQDKTVTLTVRTNEETLGAALYALELTNDPSFFDVLNGIHADWTADGAYWAFYIGEDYAMYGIDDAVIEGGERFRLVYTKDR